jgi:DNA invertase Pin-like site-specific DNA recombinase
LSTRKTYRCAIYTRKSSEEGLDQDFNSLEAQRDACVAYVHSQAHEGWRVVPELFDDGGYSGGNTERPALKRLMDLVRAGEVDIIVIYKIDRLTRSLTDFARMAETFDKHDVSFVSVTQQFNTTTSMGRLMLNVLLSFAQFEREITGERIRDKIAASKRKGMWMGGNPPMGYDVRDRQLVINETDASTVRRIFDTYLECGDVPSLLQRLEAEKVRTAKRYSAKGNHYGERPFTRGHLYKLLTNSTYIGRVPHKDTSHPGQHARIIDAKVWDAVQAQLTANVQGARHKRSRAVRSSGLLSGIMVSSAGNGFVESHASKGSRRYRYYVETAKVAEGPVARIPANELDTAVTTAVTGFLRDRRLLLASMGDIERARTASVLDEGERLANTLAQNVEGLRPLLNRVTHREDRLQVELAAATLRRTLGVPSDSDQSGTANHPTDASIVLNAPIVARRRGRQLKLVVGDGIQPPRRDPSLLTAISRAHCWAQQLVTGEVSSLTDIARHESVALTYVAQLVPLGFLSPTVVESILAGRQPASLTAERLIRRERVSLAWTYHLGR